MNKTITAMAMTLGMAMSMPTIEMPKVDTRRKPLPRNDERKKCKSCRYFVKSTEKYGVSFCSISGRRYLRPNSIACDSYAKRKRK